MYVFAVKCRYAFLSSDKLWMATRICIQKQERMIVTPRLFAQGSMGRQGGRRIQLLGISGPVVSRRQLTAVG